MAQITNKKYLATKISSRLNPWTPKVTQLPVLADPKQLLLLSINRKFVNKNNLLVTLHRFRGYKNIVFIEHLFHSAISNAYKHGTAVMNDAIQEGCVLPQSFVLK